MRMESVTNDRLIIQAKDQQDYELAEKVADKMVKDNDWIVVASVQPSEFWIHMSCKWANEQAGWFKDAYLDAKKEIVK